MSLLRPFASRKKRKKRSAARYVVPALTVAAAGAFIALRKAPRSLAGRVALITGGSRGLGLQLARELAAQGCRLILLARNPDELSRASEELTAKGAEVRTIVCDLTKEEEIQAAAAGARSAFGRIDILINSAGEITVGPIETLTEEVFHHAMDIMFWAGLRMTLALLPDMIQSGDADIVNITSIGGKIPMPHLLPYVAAKFAMTGFSEGLYAEMRSRGVHVLTVAPGLMRTGAHLQAKFTGKQDQEYRWFALGATVPGFSMHVSRAARQIVDALIARKPEIVLTASAQAAARVYGAFPICGLKLLKTVNRFVLPGTGEQREAKMGKELHPNQPAAFRAVTTFGQRAAQRQNQV